MSSPGNPAASPWLMPAAGRRLRVWSGVQVDAVRAVIGQACGAWAADWGLAPDDVAVRAITGEQASGPWLAYADSRRAGCLWLQGAERPRSASEVALFGDERTPVSDEIVQAWRTDFRHRLVAVFGVQESRGECDALPAHLAAAWSGALVLTCGPGGMVIADADAVLRLPGASTRTDASPSGESLCGIDRALASVAVDFDLELAPCDIAAADFLGLAAGDVVCLPHPLDAPGLLRDPQGRDCFRADLLKHDGRRAAALREDQDVR